MPRSLEETLKRIERLFDEEDLVRAKKELAQAGRLFPGESAIKEWEATVAADEGRFEDAVKILDGLLQKEPGSFFAARERASVLFEMGRFPEALKALQGLLHGGAAAGDRVELASIHFEIGSALDRLGKLAQADAAFQEANRLAPQEYPVPARMNAAAFESAVAKAIDSIPEIFQAYLQQVAVVVRDYPAEEDPDPFLLGLYVGVPRTERSQEWKDNLDTVFIYKRNHELSNLKQGELLEEIRKTVIHEIAHHFGLGEEEMGEYA